MKKGLLILAFTIVSTACFSQTKRIAHRSHSGSNSSFRLGGIDNFGETPEMKEERMKKAALEKAKQDSIARKAVADSLAQLKNASKKLKTKNKGAKKITSTR